MFTVYTLDKQDPTVVHVILDALDQESAINLTAKVRSERITQAARDRVQLLPDDEFQARFEPTSPNRLTGVLRDG